MTLEEALKQALRIAAPALQAAADPDDLRRAVQKLKEQVEKDQQLARELAAKHTQADGWKWLALGLGLYLVFDN